MPDAVQPTRASPSIGILEPTWCSLVAEVLPAVSREQIAEAFGGVEVHGWQDVGVGVQGQCHGGVSEAFGDDLDRNARLQEQCRVSVTQIM